MAKLLSSMKYSSSNTTALPSGSIFSKSNLLSASEKAVTSLLFSIPPFSISLFCISLFCNSLFCTSLFSISLFCISLFSDSMCISPFIVSELPQPVATHTAKTVSVPATIIFIDTFFITRFPILSVYFSNSNYSLKPVI